MRPPMPPRPHATESDHIEIVGAREHNLDVPFLQGVLTSTENLAVAIWAQLAPHVPGLHEVFLRETPNNAVSYRGE